MGQNAAQYAETEPGFAPIPAPESLEDYRELVKKGAFFGYCMRTGRHDTKCGLNLSCVERNFRAGIHVNQCVSQVIADTLSHEAPYGY